jgi:hypothetical protein
MTYERRATDMATTSDATTGAAPVLAMGCPVYTADGDKLGTVKEIRGSAFKVDAPMHPDYWLSTGSIRLAGSDRIDLAFPKDRLGDYKLDSPVQG